MTAKLKLNALVGVTFCLIAQSGAALAATTVETFQFYGTCADCTLTPGPLGQIADLVVQNYTQGSMLGIENFVSLKYYGSNLVDMYSVVPEDVWVDDNVPQIGGSIGPNLPKKEDFYVVFADGLSFVTSKTGNWFTCDYDTNYNGRCNYINNADTGSGQWGSPVPEPGSYGLLALGLLGLALRKTTLRS